MIRLTVLTVVVLATLAAVSAAQARTIAPTRTQRAGVLKAFGDPPAASRCLIVRLAASDHRYATVRFDRSRRCERWAADGVSVIRRGGHGRWRVAFEGSSYACPVRGIPRTVQRDLGVCPHR